MLQQIVTYSSYISGGDYRQCIFTNSLYNQVHQSILAMYQPALRRRYSFADAPLRHSIMDVCNSRFLNLHGKHSNIRPDDKLRVPRIRPQMGLSESVGIWARLHDVAPSIEGNGSACTLVVELVEVMNEKGDAVLILQHIELLCIHVRTHHDDTVLFKVCEPH